MPVPAHLLTCLRLQRQWPPLFLLGWSTRFQQDQEASPLFNISLHSQWLERLQSFYKELHRHFPEIQWKRKKKMNAPSLLQQAAPPAIRQSYSRVKICQQDTLVHLNKITFKNAYSVSKAPSRRGTSNSKQKSYNAQHDLLTLLVLQTSGRQATSLAHLDRRLLQ